MWLCEAAVVGGQERFGQVRDHFLGREERLALLCLRVRSRNQICCHPANLTSCSVFVEDVSALHSDGTLPLGLEHSFPACYRPTHFGSPSIHMTALYCIYGHSTVYSLTLPFKDCYVPLNC